MCGSTQRASAAIDKLSRSQNGRGSVCVLYVRYYKNYEAEVDPDAREQLSRKFRQKMRTIARKAEDKYNEYK
jgi:uncharacterized membrane protein